MMMIQSCAEDENEDEEGKEKTFEVTGALFYSMDSVDPSVHRPLLLYG